MQFIYVKKSEKLSENRSTPTYETKTETKSWCLVGGVGWWVPVNYILTPTSICS